MANRRVLIVDDDEQIADVMAAVVRMSCGETVVVGTLRGAFESLTVRSFTVVLLDLMLPDSRAIETLKAIPALKLAGAQRVIGVTGGRTTEYIIQLAITLGAEKLIAKTDVMFCDHLKSLFATETETIP